MKNKGENLEEKKKVMLQWKKSYIEALIDELRPSGDVLEVGFGKGYAADRIKTFKPKSHTIVENNPEMAKEAKAWAAKNANVSVIEGDWQSALPKLGVFDSIFFNDYPIDNEMGLLNRINPEKIAKTSSQAKELLSMLESQISQLKVQYTDQQIEDFYQKVGQYQLQEMPIFFKKLKEYGCITNEQYNRAVKKYQLDKVKEEEDKNQDFSFAFLNACLKDHMRKGSRFTCFCKDTISKYEDSQFFENVITNPFLDFSEKVIPIKVPNFADYYKFNEALIVIVEKFS